MKTVNLHDMKQQRIEMINVVTDTINETEAKISYITEQINERQEMGRKERNYNKSLFITFNISFHVRQKENLKIHKKNLEQLLKDVSKELDDITKRIETQNEDRMQQIFNEYNDLDTLMIEHEVHKNLSDEVVERYNYLRNEIYKYEADQIIESILK